MDGRWLGRDRIHRNRENNLYCYLKNDDINYFDVNGLFSNSLTNAMLQEIAIGEIKLVAELLGYASAELLIADLLKKVAD